MSLIHSLVYGCFFEQNSCIISFSLARITYVLCGIGYQKITLGLNGILPVVSSYYLRPLRRSVTSGP